MRKKKRSRDERGSGFLDTLQRRFRHDLDQPGPNSKGEQQGLYCTGCYSRWKANEKSVPSCFVKPCYASELMLPELGEWLGLYNLLKAESLNGCQSDILRRGEVEDGDFQVFAALDNVLNTWRIERQEQERQKRG